MARLLGLLAALLATGASPTGAQEVTPGEDRLRELCDTTVTLAAAVEQSESIKAALVDAIAAAEERYEPERQAFVDCVEGTRTDGCEAAFDGRMEAGLAADREALDRMEAALKGLEGELARFAELRTSVAELIGTASCEP